MKQTTSNSWKRTPRATGSRASARFTFRNIVTRQTFEPVATFTLKRRERRTPVSPAIVAPKASSFQPLKRRVQPAAFFFAQAALAVLTCALPLRADETCSSPYMARIEGQEEFVYVWTLGVEGLGDGADKLVTIDVKPGSATYGKVIHSHSLDGRHEAHHGGFTDDRRQLWLSGLESSKIFIYDVYTNPAKPRHKSKPSQAQTLTWWLGSL